jgi:hypothetical protein
MNVLINPDSTVIKVLVRDMSLFFHNTQIMVEIPDNIFIFITVNLLTASCQDLIPYGPSKFIRVNYSYDICMRQCIRKIWLQSQQSASSSKCSITYQLQEINEQYSSLCMFLSKCLEEWQENQSTHSSCLVSD